MVGIVNRLDGLPLAIELIAAHMTNFSPAELYTQLSGSFLLHSDSWQDNDDRQRSLSNAINWSIRLLSSPAQAFVRQPGNFLWRLDAPSG